MIDEPSNDRIGRDHERLDCGIWSAAVPCSDGRRQNVAVTHSLGEVQERTFGRATEITREAYPARNRSSGDELARLSRSARFAVVSRTSSHSAPCISGECQRSPRWRRRSIHATTVGGSPLAALSHRSVAIQFDPVLTQEAAPRRQSSHRCRDIHPIAAQAPTARSNLRRHG